MLEYYPNKLANATPIYLDASALTKMHCDRAYYYTCVKDLRIVDGKPDPVLTLGSAVHRFAELVASKTDEMEAMSLSLKEFPSVDRAHFVAICAARSGLDLPAAITTQQATGIELWFEHPWLAGVSNGKTYQIIICGTIDHVTFDRKCLRVVDYKTSRSWKVEDIAKKYANSTQRSFYKWVLYKFARHMLVEPEHIAAAENLAITSQICAIQVGGKSPRWTMLAPEHMTAYQMDQFEEELRAAAHKAVRLHSGDDEPYRNGMVNGTCTWCRYANMCYSRSSAEYDIAKSVFSHVPYNPKNHTKKKEEVA